MFSLIKLWAKFSLAFIISFLILSIDVSGRSLFYYIENNVTPLRKIASKQIKEISKTGEKTVKKIFSKSGTEDKIRKKDAALKR